MQGCLSLWPFGWTVRAVSKRVDVASEPRYFGVQESECPADLACLNVVAGHQKFAVEVGKQP